LAFALQLRKKQGKTSVRVRIIESTGKGFLALVLLNPKVKGSIF
jgi:hypothetical protein